jgi:ADP-dependent glucokinase
MVFENNLVSFSLTLLIASLFGFSYTTESSLPSSPLQLLSALEKVSASPATGLRVVLGSNVCVDLVAPAVSVLGLTSSDNIVPSDKQYLRSVSDVHSTFINFFRNGAAAERSSEPGVLSPLVEKASAQPDSRRALGGNAALMAKKLSALGVATVLGGPVGPVASSLLPADVTVVDNNSWLDSFSGRANRQNVDKDEVHLILEYGLDSEIGGVKAPRANRFIITADVGNQDPSSSIVSVIKAADKTNCDALVIAGLHMIEPLKEETRLLQLTTIAEALKARSGSYSVHIELASSADMNFTKLVADTLFPLTDSVGFNEQEAAFLFESIGGSFGGGRGSVGKRTEVTGASGGNVKIVTICSVIRFILEKYTHVSRIHFHALHVHLLAHRATKSSSSRSLWRDVSGAAAAGSIVATTEACKAPGGSREIAGRQKELPKEGEESVLYSVSPSRFNCADPRRSSSPQGPFSTLVPLPPLKYPFNNVPSSLFPIGLEEHLRTKLPLNAENVVSSFSWAANDSADIEFAVVPVAACKKPLSTVGLGDAISSAGLAAHLQKRG